MSAFEERSSLGCFKRGERRPIVHTLPEPADFSVAVVWRSSIKTERLTRTLKPSHLSLLNATASESQQALVFEEEAFTMETMISLDLFQFGPIDVHQMEVTGCLW